MKTKHLLCLFFSFLIWTSYAQEKATSPWADDNFTGLEFRSVGPAFMSGRIADIAIPAITAALAILVMWNYSLNESRAREIKAQLVKRRGEL